MEIFIPLVSVAFGFVLLIGGGELLVRSASTFAAAVGISPVVVGLTVVAFATSAPELAVTVQSSFVDKTDLAVGNAVGSNIFNVLFVLGLSALVAPLIVTSRLIRIDVPLMIGASVLLLVASIDNHLGRADGILLFSLLVGYIYWTVRASRTAQQAVQDEFAQEYGKASPRKLFVQVLIFGLGLLLLVAGAHFAVQGSVKIATLWGVSELIIGLTIIAVGTSLPEVVTSIVASYRGERDIAVGNVVGSNMFNILGVLGLGSVVAPNGIGVSIDAVRFDIPVMIAVAFACLPIFFIGYRISRSEGAILFGYYLAYTSYLVLDSTGNGLARILENVLVFFVVPLTVLTISIGVYRYWRRLRAESNSKPV